MLLISVHRTVVADAVDCRGSGGFYSILKDGCVLGVDAEKKIVAGSWHVAHD